MKPTLTMPSKKEDIHQPLLWDADSEEKKFEPVADEEEDNLTSNETNTSNPIPNYTVLPTREDSHAPDRTSVDRGPDSVGRDIHSGSGRPHSHQHHHHEDGYHDDSGAGDMVGGCSCSWALPGWSTPPGGDQQKSRKRRAMCISLAIITIILLILATICHYAGSFGIVRTSSNATFHTIHLAIDRNIIMTVYPSELGSERSDPTNETVHPLLNVNIGRKIPQHVPYDLEYSSDGSSLVLDFKKFATLTIAHFLEDGDLNDQFQCYNISWKNAGASECTFEDALELGEAHWYGGAPIHDMTWPMETWNFKSQAFITGDSKKGYYGGIQARYWLSSNGIAVHVDRDIPLFVGVNHKKDGLLSLASKCASPYTIEFHKKPDFKYTLCHSSDGNMKSTHQKMTSKFIPKPKGVPDTKMMNFTVWSTWAQFKQYVTQDIVLDYGKQIHDHGFSPGQLEIDDDWTPHYGDLEFDQHKFPDPGKMVNDLKDMGFRVTLWTHPFASPLSHAFYEGSKETYWVQNWLLDVPAVVIWGEGLGSILDVTNPKAIEWYMDKLTSLQTKYGIHSFKFDDGEASWLPSWRRTHKEFHNPNEFTLHYAQMAHRADPTMRSQEVRAGIGTQDLPMFTRIKDKYSNWGTENGLKTLIPHVLTFGIIGYPFVLADMIGGNAYSGLRGSAFPERELYIRWIQVSALFPVMQFSVPPWHYDDEVTAIALKMTSLHQKYSPLFVTLAEESTRTGAPIVRPMWWVCPQEEVCQTMDSQYLVGDDLLVAPVTDEGARSVDVYLPEGKWHDHLQGDVLTGPQWLRDYPAPLEDLPLFIRQRH